MEQTLKSEKPVFLEITKEQSERINIYKAFLAIMVVFIHAYPEKDGLLLSDMNYVDVIQYIISQIICRCAVPAYFFLSALFLYRKPFNYKTNLVRKLKTLGIPYLIMNTVWIVFFLLVKFVPVIGGLVNTDVSSWGLFDFLDAYLGFENGSPILYPLWFIRDLLVLNVLASVVGKIVEKIPVVSVFVAFLLWLLVPETGLFFLSMSAIVFWVFGCAVCKISFDIAKFDKIPVWLISVVYLLCLIADSFTVTLKFGFVFHNVCIVIGMLFWYVCTKILMQTRIKKILLTVSTYSFGIYIFHEMSLTLFKKVCAKILPDGTIFSLLQYFVIPIIIIVGCIILSMLLKRFVPALYKLLTGSR